MTSESTTAFSWIWLPHETNPVPAGRLDRDGDVLLFTYGRSYLERSNAIALYLPELPLQPGPQTPLVGVVAGCIRDEAPDSWGQRVIENSLAGQGGSELGLLTYLLHSGSNRIGALDFQLSASEYAPRDQQIEYLGMELARRCGLNTAKVELIEVLGKQVLLVERFDRPGDGTRLAMVSALTVLGLDEMGARYASYADLADQIRARFTHPAATLARTVRPHDVQHPHRQHRRPRPEPRCLLGR